MAGWKCSHYQIIVNNIVFKIGLFVKKNISLICKLHIMFSIILLLNCSYRSVKKSHNPRTPPKKMVWPMTTSPCATEREREKCAASTWSSALDQAASIATNKQYCNHHLRNTDGAAGTANLDYSYTSLVSASSALTNSSVSVRDALCVIASGSNN